MKLASNSLVALYYYLSVVLYTVCPGVCVAGPMCNTVSCPCCSLHTVLVRSALRARQPEEPEERSLVGGLLDQGGQLPVFHLLLQPAETVRHTHTQTHRHTHTHTHTDTRSSPRDRKSTTIQTRVYSVTHVLFLTSPRDLSLSRPGLNDGVWEQIRVCVCVYVCVCV